MNRPRIHRPHGHVRFAAVRRLERKSSTARGYGARWRKATHRFRLENPLCSDCERRGIVTLGSPVDHIIPATPDQDIFWDENNWRRLCTPCHSKKTNKQDGGFGNPVNKQIA